MYSWEIMIRETDVLTAPISSLDLDSWYTRSPDPFLMSTSASSSTMTNLDADFLMRPSRDLYISAGENPLSGNPGS